MQVPDIVKDVEKRHDVVLLFDVANGNPNGDPDADNLPRIDPETMHGLVTDVCLKRKVRDYVAAVKSQRIFIQSEATLNALITKGFKDAGVEFPVLPLEDVALVEWFSKQQLADFSLDDAGNLVYAGESPKEADIQRALIDALDDEEEAELKRKLRQVARDIATLWKGRRGVNADARQKAREQLCKDYYDIRMFGAVLQTGLNAGQVRGPFQFTFARSIDPILPLELLITRKARTTAARLETGTTEMGRKAIVPYGLYRAHAFYNPFFATQTGVSTADLELFWEAAVNMFDLDRSAARGEMALRGLYIFSHDSKQGNAPAHRLFQRIRVRLRDGVDKPRSFDDYLVEVDERDMPHGVTLTRLVDG